MVEARKLPLSDGWVLVPRERAARPHDFRPAEAVRLPTRCPFCAGHEAETPDPLAVYPAGATADWQVRVVPNKYPAVLPLPPLDSRAARRRHVRPPSDHAELLPPPSPALGQGPHEVIIESPRHVTQYADLTVREAQWAWQAYRDRLCAHRADPRLACSLVFRNSGIAGGASLEHVHSQIISSTWIPSALQTELRYATRWHEQEGECLYCRLLQGELDAGRRIVAETRSLVAWCPYASRFAYETWIAPRKHLADFSTTSDRLLSEVARLARDVIGRIERLPGRPGYNFWLHTAPWRRDVAASFHWHVEIAPRIAFQAGFEWGGGDFINAVPPEDAAATLRG
ncbi:MAG: hypothetical protein U0935_24630 [Pirellulales bacterium]